MTELIKECTLSGFSESELRHLIAEGETNLVELKVAVPRPTELAERMCGMANAQGGFLIIGVEDNTLTIKGVNNIKDAIDSILRATRQIQPQLSLNPPEPEVYILDEKKVLVATIPKSSGPVYQSSGSFWVRKGTHTIPLSYFELLELGTDRGYSTWEERPAKNASMKDLDLDRVRTHLLQRAVRPQHRSRLENLEEVLVDLGCAIKVEGELKPTNAGILFFGHNPQLRIPQSEVVCVLFQDKVGVGRYLDRRIIHGTTRELIDLAEQFIEQHMIMGGKIVGWKRQDLPEYSIESLREAVVNAIIHRDYNKPGEIVKIFKYPDRIEIRSPGMLLPGVTLDLIKQGKAPSKLRNPTLGNLLRDIPGYFERIGSGIRFMLEEARQNDLPLPDFQEQGEFMVTFRHNPSLNSDNEVPNPALHTETKVSEKQRKRQIIALQLVRQNGSITSSEYMALAEISDRTALRDLEELVRRGSLRKIGKRRSSRYELPH
jgi:ATP-dependent DNA helicase RecG